MGAKGAKLKGSPKKVVLDTNVLLSALLFAGRSSKIITLLESKAIVLVISKEILEEYVQAMAYPKFSLSDDEIKSLVGEAVLSLAKTVRSPKLSRRVCRDPEDDKFLACAKAARVNVIVSGDKDLLMLHQFEGIPIKSVSAFLEDFDK